MQTAEALLIGFLGAAFLIAIAVLLWLLHKIEDRMATLTIQVRGMEMTVDNVHRVLMEARQHMSTLQALVRVMLKAGQSMDQTTEAIRALTGLMVVPNPPHDEPPPLWTRGAPPLPPNPLNEQYARPEDAGYLEQSDEDLAEIERQNDLREQGIETDPMRIPPPSPSQINLTNV